MRLKIYPVGEKDDDCYWILELTDQGATLTDDNDKRVARWKLDQVRDTLLLPSFWHSRKRFVAQTKSGNMEFILDAKQEAKVRKWLDEAYVRVHPDAANRVLMIASGLMLGGLALTIFGILATYSSIHAAANNPNGGKFAVYYGLILFGIVLGIRGLVKALEYGKWSKLSQDINANDEE